MMRIATINATRNLRRQGISILEVVVSAAILGMIGVVTLQGVAAVHMSHMDTVDTARAHLLARDLMDEVLLNEFADNYGNTPGSDPENRANFDDIGDYDGWNADGEHPPQYKDGSLIDVGSGWARKVQIRNVRNDDITSETGTKTALKKIIVDVYRNDTKLHTLTTLRTWSWKSAQTLE